MPSFAADSGSVFSYPKPTPVGPELFAYIKARIDVDDPVAAELKADATAAGIPDIWVSEDTVAFLCWLIRAMRIERILEVGTLVGYSSLQMARAMPESGRVVTLEKDPKHLELAKKAWGKAGVAHKIEAILGDANKTIAEQTGTFDLVFIDADKENHAHYFEAALARTRSGGIIALDNAFAFGRILEPNSKEPMVAAVQELNNRICARMPQRTCFAPVGDGVLLVLNP